MHTTQTTDLVEETQLASHHVCIIATNTKMASQKGIASFHLPLNKHLFKVLSRDTKFCPTHAALNPGEQREDMDTPPYRSTYIVL